MATDDAATRQFLRHLERRHRAADRAAAVRAHSGSPWSEPGWHGAGYDAGEMGRLTGDWNPGTIGPNRLHQLHARTIRERVRDLERNNPKAVSAINAFLRNVISQGITPKPQIANATLRSEWEDEWEHWAGVVPGSDFHCDLAQRQTLYGIQTQILREIIVAGGVLVVFNTSERIGNGRRHPLAIELVPEERIAEENDSWTSGAWVAPRSGNPIVRGVELDRRTGRHLAYWVKPAQVNDVGGDEGRPVRIDASRCRYLSLLTLTGQVRGISLLAPIVLSTQRLGGYLDSELVAAEMKAQWAYMVQSSDDAPDLVSTLADDASVAVVDADGNKLERMSPGSVYYGRPGDKISAVGPNVPQSDSVPWINLIEQSIAQGLDLSAIELSRDYSRVNFSSARAAMNRDRKTYRFLQSYLIDHILNRVWYEWVRGAVLVGRPGFPAAQAFLDDPDQYLKVRWRTPGWDTVNPVDDAQAQRIMLQDGTITREEICAARGVDWEETQRQWELENSVFGMAGDPAKNAAMDQADDDSSRADDPPPVEPLEDPPGEDT